MFRAINQETLEKYGGRKLFGDLYQFPIISVYNQEVGQMVYMPNSERKHDHQIYPEYKRNSYLYNERVLVDLFYGKPVIVTEGVFDCLSVSQYGLPCVASTTNNLRVGQIEKIYRYTNKLVFWLDSDDAGQNGLDVSLKRLAKYDTFKYRVFQCNAAKDANDLLQKDPAKFEEEINKIKNIMETFND